MTEPGSTPRPPKVTSLTSNIFKTTLGLAITVGCVYLVLQKVSLQDLIGRLATVQWPFVGLGVVSLVAGYALRIWRWKIMLGAGSENVGFFACVPPFLGAITLNNVLPLRSGDLLRAFVFPASIGVGRVLSLTSLVVERVLDILVLSLAIVVGILLTRDFPYPGWVLPAVSLLGLGVVGGIVVLLLFSTPLARLLRRLAAPQGTRPVGIVQKLAQGLDESLEVFLQVSTPLVALKLFVVSVLSWLFEAGVFLCFFFSMGIANYGIYSVMVMAVGTFSTLIPSSPGYVGTFHLAVSSLLVGLGLDGATATGYAVLVHLGLWLPTTVAGIFCMAMNPGLFKAGVGKNKSSRSIVP